MKRNNLRKTVLSNPKLSRITNLKQRIEQRLIRRNIEVADEVECAPCDFIDSEQHWIIRLLNQIERLGRMELQRDLVKVILLALNLRLLLKILILCLSLCLLSLRKVLVDFIF